MTFEKIVWETKPPGKVKEFPCLPCKKAIAEYRVRLFDIRNDPPMTVCLLVCPDCLKKGERFLQSALNRIKKRRIR